MTNGTRFLVIGFAAVLMVTELVAAEKAAARGKVALVKKLNVKGFSSECGLRLGDLDGDHRLDIVLAQHRGQSITCVTAIDIDGKILWRVGRPDPNNYRAGEDLAVQIYDIDRDGRNEVICVMDDKLKILNGRNGILEKEAPLPAKDARDCIVIANFSRNEHPQDILIKNRYEKTWALDRNLEVMWSHSGNTGHYPWPYDFDGDGRDELMCGYTLLNPDGTKKWEAILPGHCDAVAIDNVDGDAENTKEIALACCGGNTFALLNDKGKVLWRHPCGHSQHIVIGDFRPDLAGKEVCALDRGNDRSASGVDAMIMYSADGKQLWREKRTDTGKNRWLSEITMVANWENRPGDLVLAYQRGGTTPPALYDGYGRTVAVFPLSNPEAQNYAQHADICGDDREEILIWNEKEMYIYKNADKNANPKIPEGRPQTKRLYNYTHYKGMP